MSIGAYLNDDVRGADERAAGSNEGSGGMSRLRTGPLVRMTVCFYFNIRSG